MALQIRRGTEAERTAGGGVVFAEGELVYITDTDSLYVGDGSTAGGVLLTGSALAAIGNYLVADTINSTLDLQQDLDLNGNDIIGTGNININGTITATGNINIGDNENVDTVDFTAKITSSLTPQADSTYDIGTMSARWQNGYFTGLVVDGQVDAVSVNADVVADNSTVMVDVSANTFTGNLTGNVTGDLSGNVTGDLSGNVTGNTTGYHTGDVKGSVFGDDSSPIVDAVANQVRATGGFIGDLTGNLRGDVKASNGVNILVSGTNGLNANYVGSVQGNVTGNLSGNVTGNVTGNLTGNTTGFHTGDVKGSIFSDGSEMLIDGVAGRIIGPVFSDVTGNVTGDLTGSVLGAGSEVIVDGTSARFNGTLVGNVLTNSIDSEDSSFITITPAIIANSDVIVENDLTVRNKLLVQEIQSEGSLYTNFRSETNFYEQAIFYELVNCSNGLQTAEFIQQGVRTGPGENDFDVVLNINPTKAEFAMPIKFPVYADGTARDAAIPSPEIGMVVITGTTMQINTDGTTGGWVSVSTS